MKTKNTFPGREKPQKCIPSFLCPPSVQIGYDKAIVNLETNENLKAHGNFRFLNASFFSYGMSKTLTSHFLKKIKSCLFFRILSEVKSRFQPASPHCLSATELTLLLNQLLQEVLPTFEGCYTRSKEAMSSHVDKISSRSNPATFEIILFPKIFDLFVIHNVLVSFNLIVD